jgi:hypothetical protein
MRRFDNCEAAPFSLNKEDLKMDKKKERIDFTKIRFKFSSPNEDFFEWYGHRHRKGEPTELE